MNKGAGVEGALRGACPMSRVRSEVLATPLTTFQIGGPLQILFEPASEHELALGVRVIATAGVEWRILGCGSNLLVPTAGVRGVTIKLGRSFKSVTRAGDVVTVGAATALMALSRELSEAGLSGLEFAGGIPASLGGAVRMNAGAHGGEMARVVRRVRGVLPTGELVEVSAAELDFGYRHASLPVGLIVTAVTLELKHGDREVSMAQRAHFLAARKAAQPLQVPSAGSIFRNPAQESAGRLIERLNLKGLQCGGAEISALHGNWIVNPDRRATDADVKSLIATIQDNVRAQTQIELTPELVIW